MRVQICVVERLAYAEVYFATSAVGTGRSQLGQVCVTGAISGRLKSVLQSDTERGQAWVAYVPDFSGCAGWDQHSVRARQFPVLVGVAHPSAACSARASYRGGLAVSLHPSCASPCLEVGFVQHGIAFPSHIFRVLTQENIRDARTGCCFKKCHVGGPMRLRLEAGKSHRSRNGIALFRTGSRLPTASAMGPQGPGRSRPIQE